MRNPQNPANSPMIQPKLTEAQVREILATYKMARKLARQQGRTVMRRGLVQELASKYGVAVRTIHHVRMRTRWRHLK